MVREPHRRNASRLDHRSAGRRPPRLEWEIDWAEPDYDQHQYGVRSCLEAIGAGEIYQACVCTQFTGTVDGSTLDFFADAAARTKPARAGPTWPATGARWRRCHRSCSCGAAVTTWCPARSGDRAVAHRAGRPARLGQGCRGEHHDRRPGAQRPGPHRRRRHRHRCRTADRAARAGGGIWCRRWPPGCPPRYRTHRCWPRRSHPRRSPEHRRSVPGSFFRDGNRDGAGYCGTIGLASPIAGTELNVAIRTVEFDAHGGAVLASAAGSPPTPIRPRVAGMPAQGGADRRLRIPRAQHRVVELTARRCAGMRVDHPRARVLTRMPPATNLVDRGDQRAAGPRSAGHRPAPR